MNVIVIGAGEVGLHLARVLSSQDHDVVLIDNDRKRLAGIEERLDVTTLHGDGTHQHILCQADVAKCDLLLAVSNRDNVNLVASRLATGLGARRSVVRTSHLEAIVNRRGMYRALFNVSFLLSTQLLTTSRIMERVRQHHNQMIEEFLGGVVQLRQVEVEKGSRAASKTLAELGLPSQALAVAMFRGNELSVPRGETGIDPGDRLLIVASAERMARAERLFSEESESLGTVVVVGGGETAQAVCRALLNYPVRLKVIERNKERCTELAQALPQAMVLHGTATDTTLLMEEFVERATHFLALTGDDETNVVASLLARDQGVRKIITLVHRPDMVTLCQRIGLDATLSPRQIAAERILEYIESDFISNIATVAGGRAHIFERVAQPGSRISGRTLADGVLPAGALVVAIQRGEDIWVPHGDDAIEDGDLLVLFSLQESLDAVVAALEPA